ncbi:MAG: S8 family serine peptidase [Bacteroidaceae bacterium]|nr:S8 family serine peptidase [Bacteroidaceae bacterium]
MKNTLWCMASAMLLTTLPVLAQSNNNADGVVKIDRHATRDYREGEMIVKFKESAPVRVKAMGKKMTSGVNKVDQVFSELGVTAGEQLMPLTGEVQVKRTKALKSVTGQVIEDADMTRLYRLQFDAKKVNVYQAIEKLQALDEVEYAEPNYVVYALATDESVSGNGKADDPLKNEQWGHGQLKLDFLWKQKPITDKRPVIAILDTGVDIEHPDLKDNVWTNIAELEGAEGEDDDNNGFADDLHGYDFVNNTARLEDWNGHGTHCAGIAAAVGGNKIGITGANPYALIMPITVMQSDGTGDVATIIKGIDYAAANGADVISMSIGGYGYSIAEEQALAKAYATAVLVAAAGNDGHDMCGHHCPWDAPMFPAAFTFVLGVEAGTQDGGLAAFSNFDCNGPIFSLFNEEQLYNYELRAPGVGIMSTYPGGKYKKLNGTSMACPYVAGGISRLLQVKEYGNWEILFGDLIHARKKSTNQLVDFEAAYKITDADRKPTLGMVTYTLKDTIQGDGDGRPDAGETIALYPTFRNEWGQAKNIRFSLEVAETEDPTIIEVLDSVVDFGKQLSSYGKNISANPLRFKVREDCADGRHICLVLRATCDNAAEELVHEFTITAENGVEIGGMITEDLTLYPNVHYIVTKTILVPEGVTLTILPGTVLKFKDGSGFKLDANTLVCKGTPDSPIVFTMADLDTQSIPALDFGNNLVEYALFENISFSSYDGFANYNMKNCTFNYISGYYLFSRGNLNSSNIFASKATKIISSGNLISVNAIGNNIRWYDTDAPATNIHNSNMFGNTCDAGVFSVSYNTGDITLYKPDSPSYFGSSRQDIVRYGIYDYEHPTNSFGYGVYDLSNMLTRPSADAHAVVWKVVVNGYDAQDEFEQLPPLGVGKHKFEVYFSLPMDKSITPFVAMGVRPPYTQNTIAEEGSWNEDGTIYTAYLTITGKTGADGLNRIYVADAVESSEDYYLREELNQMSSKLKELLGFTSDSIYINYFDQKVTLQSADQSIGGYVTSTTKYNSATSLDGLFDGRTSTWNALRDKGWMQVDLGEGRGQRYVAFDILSHSQSDDADIEAIQIQASNDGISFTQVGSYMNNRVEFPTIPVSYTFGVDALQPYRYYRLTFNLKASKYDEWYALDEFGLKTPNEALFNDETATTYLKSTRFANWFTESRDNVFLKSSLDQMYEAYNNLATAKGEPTIEQQPVEVPSTPMWKIPVENMRFNVQVEAAGSMATGLMAEAGLGKVKLTWETDEEDFADLLGYNIYRYTEVDDSVSVQDYNKYGDWGYHWEYFTRMDTTIVNPNVLEADETAFTDYDVIPGTTYYYFIKQLTTSLTSHALSNAVAATPLTAQKGDANGSMNVDIADVVTEVAYITFQDPQPFIYEAADVNSDEEVDILDVVGTLGIIINPAQVGASGMDDTPVHYYVKEGVLYMENTQPLGGVQVRLHAQKGTEFTVMDGLDGMEQTCVWTADDEFLLLAYSMSGHTIMPGTHALLKMGDEAVVTQIVLSDAKGGNVAAVNGTTTGIDEVKAGALNIPTPNPFTTYLNVPYIVGLSGDHEVDLKFCDLSGRVVDAYSTIASQGKHNYTWQPRALQKGLYMVALYVDGQLVQSAKVICAGK